MVLPLSGDRIPKTITTAISASMANSMTFVKSFMELISVSKYLSYAKLSIEFILFGSIILMAKIKFDEAPDVKSRIDQIAIKLGFNHIDVSKLICFRSKGSSARVYARIWELPRVWQMALDVKPHYVIEVLSEHFDKQSEDEKDRILIHELMHIPETFSGALKSHNCFGKKINSKTVEVYYKQLIEKESLELMTSDDVENQFQN